jgi:hypothetical protein
MGVYLSDDYQIPGHVSYSALTTYIDCGYLYYLSRLLQIPEKPASMERWWLGLPQGNRGMGQTTC